MEHIGTNKVKLINLMMANETEIYCHVNTEINNCCVGPDLM